MKRELLLFVVLAVGAQSVSAIERAPRHASRQRGATATAPAPVSATSRFVVIVPHPDAELTVENLTIAGPGTTREFDTRSLAAARTYRYTVVVQWRPNGYTTMTRRRVVAFRPGTRVNVDLTVDDPTDRVRVVYVPTPFDVADEMVKLAGVGTSDIVFEPGCGDARMLIAAVKAGALRGVGIDIDAERVAESKARVRQAGLEPRIDIRLGDALDIKDLSKATVVLLYMGDHFNMLLRPILWRELPVGARIVSHRFTMGDWTPDKSVTVTSEEGAGDYELHLWTVTDAVKRRGALRQIQ
jgi:uncharacterized protein (TIGR03000 family)